MGGSYAPPTQQGHGNETVLNCSQEAQAAVDTRLKPTAQAREGLFAEGCGRMAEFLALAPWSEKREGLRATQPEMERHLHSHNSIYHLLTVMLEELPAEAIPTADSKKFQQLHRILQQSRMPGWPGGCLQPEISTLEFDGVISEIAEFETLRLGFLIMIKETLLTVYDKLTNPPMTEVINQPPQLAHLLDVKPAMTWIQFILPEELIDPTLQRATLQATFGSLGKIAEIFLFEPRPEDFIILNGSLQIPNFEGILSPQHGLIMIKTPGHPSLPIQSTAAPHYPTRRPAIGTLVTLSSQGHGQLEATIVAIEQNHWPREWIYMIRTEKIGKSPELIMAILDRGSLNSQDISTRICPKAVLLENREVAFFFNKFERLIQVTIVQKGSPGYYETVRMVQPLQAHLSPIMKLQDIESHRLFTVDMSPPNTANPSEETQSGLSPKSMIKWGPKIVWNSTSDTREDSVIDQAPLPARQIDIESNPYLEIPPGSHNRFGGRETEIHAKGWMHRGYLKKKTVPRSTVTENSDKMAPHYFPIHLFGPSHPSYSDRRHRQ